MSGHVTKMAVTPLDPPYLKTPVTAVTNSTSSSANLMAVMFYRTGVMANQSFTLRK